MANYQDIRTLARSLIGQVTQNGESWKAFLDSAAYTYNYAFPNQLLIYSQRPNATAVASIDYWNNKALRWVNRGSHGIALLDSHSSRGKLRYVFDIADTHGRGYVQQAMPWMVDNTNRQQVWDALKQAFAADTVQNALALQAATQAAEHRTQIAQLLETTVSGSTLEWRHREEQQKMLEKLMAQSAAYMVAVRCGIDTALLDTDAFATVSEFDTDAIAVALGSLTAQVSRPMMQSLGSLVRQIDSVALAAPEAHNQSDKENETKKEASRDGVHPSERVSDPESDTERATGPADWQVRRDPQGVPAGERAGDLRPDAAGGDSVSPPGGDGQRRADAGQPDHGRTDPADAAAQPENQSVGLDAADEPAESAGRGTGDADAVRPVNEDTQEPEAESAETLPAFFVPEEQSVEMGLPDEEQQTHQVEQAAATAAVKPLAPPVVDRQGEIITEQEITRALCAGSGFENGKQRIQYYFSQPVLPTMDETVHWLKKEYGIGGRSWELTDGSQGWLDYNCITKTIRRGKGKGKLKGFPLCGRCNIQRDCKVRPIQKYMKSLSQETQQYVGLATDEQDRLLRLQEKQISLLEQYACSEAEAWELCRRYGLLSPVYDFTDRNGCWFCPNAKLSELRHLYDHHPDLWREMLALQALPNKVTDKFDRDFKFSDYDLLFRNEDAQLCFDKEKGA